MNITLEKNEGAVAGKLIVNIVKADYEEKLAASLKKMKQRAQMPGFRKGMVPMSLIQKMYGTEVKADELQKIYVFQLFRKQCDDVLFNLFANIHCGIFHNPRRHTFRS